jgi:hypothetical protein
MKKLLTVVFIVLLAGGLALAGASAGLSPMSANDKARATADAKKTPKGGNVQKVREAQKAHKGGKKGKKGSGSSAGGNPPPK